MSITTFDDWMITAIEPTTRCKHGTGSCDLCGTRDRSDAIHAARAPNKRSLRRKRRKAKGGT